MKATISKPMRRLYVEWYRTYTIHKLDWTIGHNLDTVRFRDDASQNPNGSDTKCIQVLKSSHKQDYR